MPKKGSRRKARKRNARKIDVTDVEESERARRREALEKTKSDSQLFVVDRQRSSSPGLIITRTKRRKLAQEKVTFAEKSLLPPSSVPTPVTKRATGKGVEEKIINVKVDKMKKRKRDNTPLPPPPKRERRTRKATKNLWELDAPPPKKLKENETTKRRKEEDEGTKGGSSYRPDKVHHQDALGVALAEEVTKKRKRDEVENYFKVSSEVQALPSEMRVDVSFFPHDSDGVDSDSLQQIETSTENSPEKESFLVKEPSVRKTKQQRKKEEKEKRRKNKGGKRRKERQKEEFGRLDEILEEVDEKERKREERVQYHREKRAESSTKRLGKHKPAEMSFPVLLTEELPGSMRQMPSVGQYNPVKEQFISLQKKGAVEPRKRIKSDRRYPKVHFRSIEYKQHLEKLDKVLEAPHS